MREIVDRRAGMTSFFNENRLRRSWAGMGLLMAFVLAVLATHEWDAKAFVMEGSLYRTGEASGTIGYDGQFAYYIALDPPGAAEHIDRPAYRYQRILYPALAWLISMGGKPVLLLWVMIAINVAALWLTWLLLGDFLEKRGIPAWYGVNFLLFAGVIIALRADLNEPLAICLALLGWRLWRDERWRRAGVALGLALLAKEVAVTFLAGVVVWTIIQRRFRVAIIVGMIGILPAVLWGIWLNIWLGESPLGTSEAAMEWLPFYGLRFVSVSPAMAYILLWVLVPTIFMGALVLLDVWRGRITPEGLVLLANAALIAFMPRLTWINVAGALRATTGLALASFLYLSIDRKAWIPWMGAYWMLSGAIMLPAIILVPLQP